MAFDLEDELLRAAYAFATWREHVMHDTAHAAFTCVEVLDFIRQSNAHTAFPRLATGLVAHVVDGLAAALAKAGLFERVGPTLYALTDQAFANFDRAPVFLRDDAVPDRDARHTTAARPQ